MGVAILLNPDTITNAQPLLKELWTAAFIAVVIHHKNDFKVPIACIGFYSQPGN